MSLDFIEPVPSEEQTQTVVVYWWHSKTVSDHRRSVSDSIRVYLPWH